MSPPTHLENGANVTKCWYRQDSVHGHPISKTEIHLSNIFLNILYTSCKMHYFHTFTSHCDFDNWAKVSKSWPNLIYDHHIYIKRNLTVIHEILFWNILHTSCTMHNCQGHPKFETAEILSMVSIFEFASHCWNIYGNIVDTDANAD